MNSQFKSAFNRLLHPLASAIAGTGISPSAITLLGVALVAASCAFLIVTRRLLLFCLLATLSSLLDVVDGAVARIQHTQTRAGSYLDAMCDRYAEAMVVLAVAYVTGYWTLSMLVVVGSLLVSYAKARAAMEVSVSNKEWPDLMERGERDVMYVIGLALGQVAAWRPMGKDVFWWTLAVLAFLIHATVVQRMLRAGSLIRSRS